MFTITSKRKDREVEPVIRPNLNRNLTNQSNIQNEDFQKEKIKKESSNMISN